MDRLPPELRLMIVNKIVEYYWSYDERWQYLITTSVSDLRSVRLVCSSMRDVAWVPLGKVIGYHKFYASEDSLKQLAEILKIEPLVEHIKTLTFCGVSFNDPDIQSLDEAFFPRDHLTTPDERIRYIHLQDERTNLFERQMSFRSSGQHANTLSSILRKLPKLKHIRYYPSILGDSHIPDWYGPLYDKISRPTVQDDFYMDHLSHYYIPDMNTDLLPYSAPLVISDIITAVSTSGTNLDSFSFPFQRAIDYRLVDFSTLRTIPVPHLAATFLHLKTLSLKIGPMFSPGYDTCLTGSFGRFLIVTPELEVLDINYVHGVSLRDLDGDWSNLFLPLKDLKEADIPKIRELRLSFGGSSLGTEDQLMDVLGYFRSSLRHLALGYYRFRRSEGNWSDIATALQDDFQLEHLWMMAPRVGSIDNMRKLYDDELDDLLGAAKTVRFVEDDGVWDAGIQVRDRLFESFGCFEEWEEEGRWEREYKGPVKGLIGWDSVNESEDEEDEEGEDDEMEINDYVDLSSL